MRANVIAVMRVPTHRNNGSKVSNRELQEILNRVLDEYAGFSLEPYPGAWMASDGRVYRERSYKLEVVVSRRRLSRIRKLFMIIGKQLGQRAIYFEVREGAEIIDLDVIED